MEREEKDQEVNLQGGILKFRYLKGGNNKI